MDFDASVNPRPRARNRIFPKGFEFGRRKTPSFSPSSSSNSSLSSSSQYFPDDPPARSPLSPSTSPRFSSGVPFSWEKLPGIPKRQRNDSAASSLKLIKLLPLPPSATKSGNLAAEGSSFRKKSLPEWDPFTAALVECSKDDSCHRGHDQEDVGGSLWTGAKVSRSISDRFGFMRLYGSCKRTCAVDESVAHTPRPSRTTANPYGLIKYHHRGSIDK